DDRRPPADRRGIVGPGPALEPGPTEDSRSDVMEGRVRIEPMPDGPDERRQEREADPAVDPQEERGDVAGARPARDTLSDDPQPAEEPDAAHEIAEPGRRPATLADCRWIRTDVGDQDECERQADGDRRSREVDDQRQAAL